MLTNYLNQLVKVNEKHIDDITLSEQRWVEDLLRMAMATDQKAKEVWNAYLQKTQKETIESGKAFYTILADPRTRQEALRNNRRDERVRYVIFQNPEKGEIWCYISKTKFVLGPIRSVQDYLERLKSYVEQMKMHNKNLKNQRQEAFQKLKTQRPDGVPVQEVLPETTSQEDEIMTDEHMARWVLQIDWWEFIYSTELVRHGEGFTRAAIEANDVLAAVDGMYYFQLYENSEIVNQLANRINQLTSDKSNEAQDYLKEIILALKKYNEQSPIINADDTFKRNLG